MTYRKHRFYPQAQKNARIAKNGNRNFTLREVDCKGVETFHYHYGVPEEVIKQRRKSLLDYLLWQRKQRQEHPIAGWIEAVSMRQTRLGYDEWVAEQRGYDDIRAVLDMLRG